MTTKRTARQLTEEAIANLEAAISELRADGASADELQPYYENLNAERSKLKAIL